MPPSVHILQIRSGSDGDGRKWPKHHYQRNDDYFLERIASDKWIHDLEGGPQHGITYRLDKLPNGYAGFERQRPDTKHVDRYIYGHPNGQFRSLNEFYPHFKHLMDYGGAVGCECKNCKSANGKNRAGSGKPLVRGNDSEASASRPQRSRFFDEPAQQEQDNDVPKTQLISPFMARTGRPEQSESESPKRLKRKRIDCEGVPDVYETMIDELKSAGPEDSVDITIEERGSPDWRVGTAMSKTLLQQLQQLPRHVPRPGEIVLFVRSLKDGEGIGWNRSTRTFQLAEQTSATWLPPLKWEAGVVTQLPIESISDQDLVTDEDKKRAVNDSGFRIEPLSAPGSDHKPYSKQHKYVPLHAIRPFSLYKECLSGTPDTEWHPTIKHALTVVSSFCVIGRYRFRGVWPDATVFARGVYIGPELIMMGDAVRLSPSKAEKQGNNVTDVMVVTAIRLRFVNLDMEDEEVGPIPGKLPYQTCLHISGRVYTLDPTRSFDGVGKLPIDPESGVLPAGLSGYGQWYHYSDPGKVSGRIEVPYTRIMGRCLEDTAFEAWFSTPSGPAPGSSKYAAKAREADTREIDRGFPGVVEARNYSLQNDERIKPQEGRTWFWADSRVEQLDLHVVNNRDVGVKDKERSKGQMGKWRTLLKAIDGKKGGLEEYHAARREQQKHEETKMQSAYGMVAASAQLGVDSTTDVEAEVESGLAEDDQEDAMEVEQPFEEDEDDEQSGEERSEDADDRSTPSKSTSRKIEAIVLSDSDDEDDSATDQLVGELAKNIRPNDPRLRR